MKKQQEKQEKYYYWSIIICNRVLKLFKDGRIEKVKNVTIQYTIGIV
jgi:hypothetical protein